MQNIQAPAQKKSPLLIIVVIVEIMTIILMILAAIYFLVTIEAFKVAQKSAESTASSTAATGADCPAQEDQTAQGYYKVLGKENISVGGNTLSLCCGSIENAGKTTKVCSDKTNSNTVTYEKTGDKYTLVSEIYAKGEQRCMKNYQVGGQSAEICL